MHISNAEWQVMKIIWMKGNLTSSDLIEQLADRFSWSKSTIKTLLSRLVDKQCLSREKRGKSYLYSALLTQEESLEVVVEDVQSKVCSRKMKQVLAKLVDQSDFTLFELQELQCLLEKKKLEAVPEVACNCM
ncbi:CopY/TcrY family copper transport repressor [Streptococcus sp. DD13]|uniref:CopY/TcrY family copper transport repressor n=1 Tax=Streptococcus sp. DD13 TaxID=1777881 RepID=UPI0007934EB5|nr:CopY/TcrY family copper transport repressor [Streptococcus sp. DD13]KXT78211.1 Negative transcriptional regulator-copper transport operon [Streptococcus sp. DD13]